MADHSRDPWYYAPLYAFRVSANTNVQSMGHSERFWRRIFYGNRGCSSCADEKGAIGGSIWHGVKGFRNSPYVCGLLLAYLDELADFRVNEG